MLIGLAMIFIALMFPRKSVLAPEYLVTVSDGTGHGLAGVTVSRYIQDYSSGRNLDRAELATARIRSLPDAANGKVSPIGLTLAGTWPPNRSWSAGAPPR